MKLLIACDMEGITGVVNWDHVDPGHAEYPRFRKLMTGDVNAAVAGAAQAGVEDILVADGHHFATNILIEELDPRARLNSGSPSPFGMVQGIDTGIDAVFFIGYHARMGNAPGVCDHTWSSSRVANVWLNQRLIGEIGLNGSVCGHFGAPVILIAGDQTACAEARDFIPGIETVEVKKASCRSAAEVLSPKVTAKMIQETAVKAIQKFKAGQGPQPLKLTTPITGVIEFRDSLQAEAASRLPGAVRLDGRRVEFTAPDMATAYRTFRCAVSLAG